MDASIVPLPRLLPRAALRRDLWISVVDAAAYSVMVGSGETYFAAFALALGLGPVAAGLVTSVPVLCGALVQLVTPFGVARVGTNRGWVVACTTVQALSFLPLVWWAVRGSATLPELLVAASVYWSAGMAGGPAWTAWMATLVPERMRTPYFAQRNRLGQYGVFAGFVIGGLVLQVGERYGCALPAFAALFALAGTCRLVSTACLLACREPKPPVARATGPDTRAAAVLRNLPRRCAQAVGRPSGSLVLFLCCFVFGAQFAGPYFTPYMLREMGFSYHAFMLVFATSFLAKALVLPSAGRLASRIGSVHLLWLAAAAITPLSLLWLPSASVWYLVAVQVVAGCCWATYELAVSLLLFEAVEDRERTGLVTIYNLGLAIATVGGATCGGMLLRACGENRWAYAWVFVVSCLLRLATLPLLRWVRTVR